MRVVFQVSSPHSGRSRIRAKEETCLPEQRTAMQPKVAGIGKGEIIDQLSPERVASDENPERQVGPALHASLCDRSGDLVTDSLDHPRLRRTVFPPSMVALGPL